MLDRFSHRFVLCSLVLSLFAGGGGIRGGEVDAPVNEGGVPVDESPDMPGDAFPTLPEESVAPTNGAEAVGEETGVELEGPEAAYDNIEMLTEILLHVRDNYVEPKTITEITTGALHGMLRELDPHSDFLEPKDYSDLQEDTSGHFSGIGIHIGMREGVLTVIAPIEDTPAFKAGLLSGDRILKIGEERTVGMSLQDAVDLLRGPRGEPVTITIGRAGAEKPEDVTIVRDDIEVPSVKGVRMMNESVGYIRITQFALPTADEVAEGVRELQEEGMKALILDLRSNPGGLLKAAALVAEPFLGRGDLIVSTRGRDQKKDLTELRAGGRARYRRFPMVVLVNRGSASASEIVAGALQDHGRAILIGEKTYGKASVQSLIRLKTNEDAAIRLTTAYYYTPHGGAIHGIGIKPDIRIEVEPQAWRRILVRRSHETHPDAYSDEEKARYADAVDIQLERALDLLSAVVIFDRARRN
jgi:carboxyl-terminal processing protease